MHKTISGGALHGSIKRVVDSTSMSDAEKLRKIKLALELYSEWNESLKNMGGTQT